MAKSKLTKAKEISSETKEKVLKRQHYKSIGGVVLTLQTAEFHHYIFRSASGVGYEWNIVALTHDEHFAIHNSKPVKVNGAERYSVDEFDVLIRNHFRKHYQGWSEDKCKYKKFCEEKDYGVKNRNENNK